MQRLPQIGDLGQPRNRRPDTETLHSSFQNDVTRDGHWLFDHQPERASVRLLADLVTGRYRVPANLQFMPKVVPLS